MSSLLKNTQRMVRLDDAKITLLLDCLKAENNLHAWDVGIWVCSDTTIRSHNRQYRGISKSTDVLSFAVHQCVSQPEDFLNQAVDPYEQLVRVLTHGFVHLLGYDHTNEAQDELMLAKEASLMAALPPRLIAAAASEASNHRCAQAMPSQCKLQRMMSSQQMPLSALGQACAGGAQAQQGGVFSELLRPCGLCSTKP